MVPLKHATPVRLYEVSDLSGVNSGDEGQEERAHEIHRPALAQDAGIAELLIIAIALGILEQGVRHGAVAPIALVGVGIDEARGEAAQRQTDCVGMLAIECRPERRLDSS